MPATNSLLLPLQLRHLLLQPPHRHHQIRQPSQRRLFSQTLPMRQRRCAADDRFGIDIFRNGTAPGDHGAVADGDVIAGGGLAAEDDAGAEGDRAGQADLADDDAMRADLAVVGDLDEVVDFGAAADFGAAEFGAVDADARADFNVILDDDGTNLRNFYVLLAVPAIAEAVGAEDRAGVDYDTIAD